MNDVLEQLAAEACQSELGADVLRDWCEENLRTGYTSLRRIYTDASDADDSASDDAAADAAASASDADDAADDAAASASASDDDADASVCAAAADAQLFTQEEKIDMKAGLVLLMTTGTRWYSLVRVGWLRHVAGFEWELVGARSLRRVSGQRIFAELAKDGPQSDHRVNEPSPEPEAVFRPHVIRCVALDEKVWATHCPKPDGWQG